LGLASNAVGATTIGSALADSADTGIGCAGPPCTLALTGLDPSEAAGPIASPVDGTIVSWSFRGLSNSSQRFYLRVVRPTGGGNYTGAGTSSTLSPSTPAGDTVVGPVATSLPVNAGDQIGVQAPTSAGFGLVHSTGTPVASAYTYFTGPDLADGGSPRAGVTNSSVEVLLQATVIAVPSSSASVPACSQSGAIPASVSTDPATGAKAVHFRVDGGAEQVAATSGSPGAATLAVPEGSHSLEYWGEDQVPQQERAHHTATALVDATPPTVIVTSDQGKTTYAVGERATITTRAADAVSGLATDPSASGEPLATGIAGTFTVTKTAADRCGNSATKSFTYTVVAAPPTPTPSPSPSLGALKISPLAFRAASRGPTLSRAKRTGTTITYTDSQVAATTFTVLQSQKGVRKGKRCVRAPKRSRRKAKLRRCKRMVSMGTFTNRDRAGSNRLRFTGRVRGKKLKPGPYQLRAIARNGAGKTSRASTKCFRIIR
jgi:hypothetical protein